MEKNLRKVICSCLFSFLFAGYAYTASPAEQNTGLITPPESKSTEQLDPTSSEYIKKSLAQLESRHYQLYDGLLVFPLLDQNGKTTQLGTFIAIMGMFRATYVPEKIINLYFPETEEQYYDYGYTRDGVTLMPSDLENIKTSLRARYQATGSFIMDGDVFKATLKFEGPPGEKVFEKTGQKQELPDLPLWIASKIHEYLGIRISEEQRKYLSRPEFGSVESMLKAARAEDLYWIASRQPTNQLKEEALKTYAKLSLENPESVFLLAQYFNWAVNNYTDNPLAILDKTHKEFPTHDMINQLYAYWFTPRKNFNEAIPLLMQLLERNYKTPRVYNDLEEILGYRNLSGLLVYNYLVEIPGYRNLSGLLMVYDYWVNHDQTNYLAYLKRGSRYIDYAWEARGTGLAEEVEEKGWGDFHERLMLAEKDLKQAFQLNPEDASAPVKLIYVGLGLGKDLDYVNKWFDIAIKINPDNSSAYAQKIFYLTPKWYGSKEQMLDFTEECLKNYPKSHIAYTLLSGFNDWDPERKEKEIYKMIYNDPDVWKKIKDIFTPYLSKKLGAHNVRNLLAKYAVENNDNDYAIQMFTALGTHWNRDDWEIFDFFLEVREKTFRAMFPNLTHEDYYQTLVSAYKKRVESNPDDAGAYLDLATLYCTEKEYDLAVPQLLKAILIKPDYDEAYDQLGRAYNGADHFQEAVESYKQAIRIKSVSFEKHFELERGLFYYNRGRYQEAIEPYKQAISIQPFDSWGVHQAIGAIYSMLGRYQEAIESYKQAISFNPDDAEAQNGLGRAFVMLGRYQEAIEPYKQAVRIQPSVFWGAYYDIGVIYNMLGRYQEAIESYKQAVSFNPDYAEAHYGLGSAYGTLGRYQEAIESYKQAVSIKPDYAEAHYGLVWVYLQLKDNDSAQKEYEILKNLNKELADKLQNFIH